MKLSNKYRLDMNIPDYVNDYDLHNICFFQPSPPPPPTLIQSTPFERPKDVIKEPPTFTRKVVARPRGQRALISRSETRGPQQRNVTLGSQDTTG